MYEQNYAKLNPAQKEAVDTIDGPVLVVAGPGTGKTQLLSMRVANILRSADVLPSNILCMTFTEDAAHNMRERLASIIGQAAYDVEIHTFHSFGASVIAKYGEYFYQGIGTNPIDDLGSYQLFENIFKQLPFENPLSKQYEGEFLYLKGARSAIDDCKTAGLSPDEVKAIADDNMAFIARANPIIQEAMQGFVRIDKSSPERFKKLYDTLQQLLPKEGTSLPSFIQPLSEIVLDALESSLQTCETSGKTTALTEFKNRFLVKDSKGEWQLKDTQNSEKIRALADIYEQYLLALREQNLLDFNDMITRVVHALETFPELRLNLQEQYQYILVDEFQDTSLAQLRFIQSLTDNPLYEGKPNILAVGDDDQAIYSFQGAELSNILSFHSLYKDVTIITLTDNYRSHQHILDSAKFVIEQSQERLVHTLKNITKDITAKNTSLPEATIDYQRFASADSQRQWVAATIASLIEKGESPNSITVIGAKHRSLKEIAPFLHAKNIPIQYDKRENILDVPAIAQLITTAELLVALGNNRQKLADALLPEVLSFDFWGLSTQQIWQLYVANHRKRAPWLEIMQQSSDTKLAAIAEFLIELGLHSSTLPLEKMLDLLIGTESLTLTQGAGEQLSLAPDTFTSPFKEFFFGDEIRRKQPVEYLELLSHIRFLRDRLREFNESEHLTLTDLLEYVRLCKNAGIQLVDTTPHREQQNAVTLHTAHSSKGLEFDTVFLVDANHDIWSSSGSSQGKVSFPANMPIERRSGSEDERRRLLYVAITRAKHRLHITGFTAKKRGNAPLKYLSAGIVEPPKHLIPTIHDIDEESNESIALQLETTWRDRHIAGRNQPELRELLQPALERYRMSITHLQRFLNVAEGGPQQWLLQCLLHFPQAPAPNMAFGSAIHETLDIAHKHLKQTGEQKPTEELLFDFKRALERSRLDSDTEAQFLDFGQKVLTQYLGERYSGFQKQEFFEFDLTSRQLSVEQVPVTGKIDRITPLGNNTVRVHDFKTGRPLHTWQTSDPVRKIRLYHYKQQLAFYRLLLEESAAFGPSTKVASTALEYIQADANGELVEPLEYIPSDEEVDRLRKLLPAVWQRMQTLDFPNINEFPATIDGIIQFENTLLNV